MHLMSSFDLHGLRVDIDQGARLALLQYPMRRFFGGPTLPPQLHGARDGRKASRRKGAPREIRAPPVLAHASYRVLNE